MNSLKLTNFFHNFFKANFKFFFPMNRFWICFSNHPKQWIMLIPVVYFFFSTWKSNFTRLILVWIFCVLGKLPMTCMIWSCRITNEAMINDDLFNWLNFRKSQLDNKAEHQGEKNHHQMHTHLIDLHLIMFLLSLVYLFIIKLWSVWSKVQKPPMKQWSVWSKA